MNSYWWGDATGAARAAAEGAQQQNEIVQGIAQGLAAQQAAHGHEIQNLQEQNLILKQAARSYQEAIGELQRAIHEMNPDHPLTQPVGFPRTGKLSDNPRFLEIIQQSNRTTEDEYQWDLNNLGVPTIRANIKTVDDLEAVRIDLLKKER